ncbi:MAG: DUF3487 family protein [Akkermansiaceae bacterium]
MPEVIEYEARLSALESERVYKLHGHRLEIDYGSQSENIPLTEIAQVRCRFFPTRVQRDRFETIITMRNGRSLKIGNQLYRGLADFEDRSVGYRAFVQMLHTRLGKRNPHCVFHAGVTPLSFWLNAIFLALVLVLLVAVGVVMITAIPAVAIVKLVLIIFYLPTCIRWFKRGRPKRYSADHIPADVLPQ